MNNPRKGYGLGLLDVLAQLLPERWRRQPPNPGAAAAEVHTRHNLTVAWVHLAVLWSFAFAKPLFDVLADSPEFFVARGNTRGDIVTFALGMVLIPPTALVLVEALFTRVPPLRRALHLMFVAGLAGTFVLQLADDAVGGSGQVPIVIGAFGGVGTALVYDRTRFVPTVLTVLGPAPLVFLVVFLLISPVSKLVLPRDSPEAAEVRVRSDTPVVVVVFDEFDANMLMNAHEQIDRTRYPNFAALAEDATWYRNATTVNSHTTQAVPALLDGLRPTPDRLPITADHPNNLFTLLGASHEFNVTETATEVCPERLCGGPTRDPFFQRLRSLTSDLGIVTLHLVAPDTLRSRLPAVDETFNDFAGGGRDDALAGSPRGLPSGALTNRPGRFEAFVRGIERERSAPGLHFVHAALPHVPWQYMPSGQQYINNGPDTPGLDKDVWGSNPALPHLALQRHLLQVGYVDRLVSRFLTRLREMGLYDRALIIVTADHGVSYRAGYPRRTPTQDTASDIASVPLLVKYPNQRRGRIDDSMVQTIDVVPTIADELGVRLPWDADGRPMRNPIARARPVTVGAGTSGSVSLPFAEYVRQRKAGLVRMLHLFGSDDGGKRLYATGPDIGLLGRPVAKFSIQPDAGSRVELDSADLLDHFNPGAPVVPSFITGRIVGDVDEGVPLAVAVNGTVAGVTQSFRHADEVRLAAMVPPEAFREGYNSLHVFSVTPSGAKRQLESLALERPEEYRLVQNGRAAMVVGAGHKARVIARRLDGFVEVLQLDDQGVRIIGWAVEPAGPRPVDRIVVFDRGEMITQGRPTLPREGVAARYGASATRSGFQVRGSSDTRRLDDVRVFAVAGNVATELPLLQP